MRVTDILPSGMRGRFGLRVLERSGWSGEIMFRAHNLLTGEVEELTVKNLITDAGLNMLRDILNGDIADGEIKYVALGSGSTAPAIGQVSLVSEQFRKAVTQQTEPATGKLVTSLYVAPPEATSFTINEVGWFAGSGATATPDSGVMVARVLYSRAKTSLESIQIDRTDTLARV